MFQEHSKQLLEHLTESERIFLFGPNHNGKQKYRTPKIVFNVKPTLVQNKKASHEHFKAILSHSSLFFLIEDNIIYFNVNHDFLLKTRGGNFLS